MDIAALSMALSNQQLSTQVGMAVLNLQKDQMEQSGGEMIEQLKAMESSVTPNLGSNIDIQI